MKIIDPMLCTELVKFVDEFLQATQPEITITSNFLGRVVPRFNKKINDVVWIAGGKW